MVLLAGGEPRAHRSQLARISANFKSNLEVLLLAKQYAMEKKIRSSLGRCGSGNDRTEIARRQ